MAQVIVYPNTEVVIGSVTVNNDSIGTTGSTAPSKATEIGVIDGTGKLQPVTQGQATMAASIPVVIASNQGSIPVTATFSDPSNGSTGAAVPTTAKFVAGTDGTNLRGIKVSTAGVVTVDGSAVTQPVSGTVTANAGTGTFAVSGTVAATQSGTWNVNNVSGTVSLPTGAATAAKQPALGTAGTPSADVITVQGTTSMTALKVDGSAVTQPISAASLPLPSGAATETSLAKLTQTQGSTTSGQSGTLMQGAVTTAAPTYTTAQTSPISLTTAGAVRVDASTTTQPIQAKGTTFSNAFVRNDYTSTSVTTAAYTQLVASTTSQTNRLIIFDSSGQTMKLAIGAAASEVDQFVIPPGGIDIPYQIAAGTRISLRAISATASVGEIDINFLQ